MCVRNRQRSSRHIYIVKEVGIMRAWRRGGCCRQVHEENKNQS